MTFRHRYLVQFWHFRYNCIFLSCSLCLFLFYAYATFTTPPGNRNQNSQSWKLLLGYTLLLLLDLIHRFVLLIRMHAFLSRHGEGETDALPFQALRAFDVFSHAASAYFVVACWITHAYFPQRNCDDLEYQLACTALHTITLSFVIWMCLTILVVFISTSCCCARSMFRTLGGPHDDTGELMGFSGEQHDHSANLPARQPVALPGNPIHNLQGQLLALQANLRRRENMVHALPTSQEPPLNGDVCGVCLETDVQNLSWRVLPCGHRFHTSCVDEWLHRPDGSCPTCRKDPMLSFRAGIAPMLGSVQAAEGEEEGAFGRTGLDLANGAEELQASVNTSASDANEQVTTTRERAAARAALQTERQEETEDAANESETNVFGGAIRVDARRVVAGGSSGTLLPNPHETGTANVGPVSSRGREYQPDVDSAVLGHGRLFIPNPGGPGGGFYIVTSNVVQVANGIPTDDALGQPSSRRHRPWTDGRADGEVDSEAASRQHRHPAAIPHLSSLPLTFFEDARASALLPPAAAPLQTAEASAEAERRGSGAQEALSVAEDAV